MSTSGAGFGKWFEEQQGEKKDEGGSPWAGVWGSGEKKEGEVDPESQGFLSSASSWFDEVKKTTADGLGQTHYKIK